MKSASAETIGVGRTVLLAATLALYAATLCAAVAPAVQPGFAPANPWLAWLPEGTEADFVTWEPAVATAAHTRAARLTASLGPLPEVLEVEVAGANGSNDLPLLAEPLPVSTLPGSQRRILVRGALRQLPTELLASTEPDDAIPSARPLVVPAGSVVAVPGSIGDGLHGAGGAAPSGDFDCLVLSVPPGERVELAVVTPEPLAGLDPMVAAWDLAGTLLAVEANLPGSGFLTNLDAYIAVAAPADGVLVTCALGASDTPFFPGDDSDHLLLDPFDGASGPGAGSEGPYTFIVGVGTTDPRDRDTYAAVLRTGDVLGVATDDGARRLVVRDPFGTIRVSSGGTDLSGLYPASSPLPGGLGGPTVAVVADQGGTWTIETSGTTWLFDPAYRLDVTAERPPLDEDGGPRRQRVLVDVDGATLDRAIFGLPPGLTTLSPLAAFLPGFGLADAEYDVVVDKIVAVVDRELRAQIAASGGNGDARTSGLAGDFDIEVVDSRAGDPWGDGDTLRVVVGGTVEELGAVTIGLAEAIDPGNFEVGGTAVVLLDLLSGAAASPNSLAHFTGGFASARPLDLVAEGLGRIVAHEAGHLLAAYHSRRDGGSVQLMDRGGRLDQLLGAGADQLFGTADDIPVHFGSDDLEPAEGFAGQQNSLDAISFDAPLAGLRAETAVGATTINFGATPVGIAVDRTLDIGAVGGSDIAVTASSGDPQFSILTPQPLLIPAGTTASLLLRFVPSGEGLATTTLDLDPGSAAISLRGVGGVAAAQLAPAALDLGDLEYGPATISVVAAATLSNPGPAALLVDAVVVAGPDAALFTVNAEAPFVVAAGASHELAVTFAPTGLVGPRSARLVALSSGTPERVETTLSARAHGPDLVLSPGSPYFFGLPRPGQVRTRTFRLTNAGDRTLSLGAASVTGPDAALFTVLAGPTPASVDPGQVADLSVQFAPAELGEFAATLSLATNDPDGDPLAIAMFGTGAGGQPELEPTGPVDLGAVLVGASADTTVELRNVGALTLLISSITIEGGAHGEVTLVSPQVFGLSPGSRANLVLRFAPAAAGQRLADLVVASDAPGSPITRFALFGTGEIVTGPQPPNPLEIPTTTPAGLVLLAAALALLGAGRLARRR